MAGWNLPPGVSPSDPHFNPPTCPGCGEECTPGEDCPGCGEYVPTDEDYESEAADREYDRMRDDGLADEAADREWEHLRGDA